MVGNFIVTDNGIYFEEIIAGGMTNAQLMITKEAFVEAYEKWIVNKKGDTENEYN